MKTPEQLAQEAFDAWSATHEEPLRPFIAKAIWAALEQERERLSQVATICLHADNLQAALALRDAELARLSPPIERNEG